MAAQLGFDGLLAAWRSRIGSVPPQGPGVCPLCCGPCWLNFSDCYGCARIFAEAPASLRSQAVPITTTLEEGPWYQQLVAYKTTSAAPWPLLGGLVARFATVHRQRIIGLLGGKPTALTVVPSKRGRRVPDQPLYRLLVQDAEVQSSALPTPSPLLEHTGDAVPRQSYTPDAFRPAAGAKVKGGRIILVEDSWTSGATAVSAAGALLNSGASQVVVLPIARLIRASFWGEDHPYLQAMKQPYDITRWPR